MWYIEWFLKKMENYSVVEMWVLIWGCPYYVFSFLIHMKTMKIGNNQLCDEIYGMAIRLMCGNVFIFELFE